MVASSAGSRRNWRPMTWPAMISAARAAMPPKTARAIEVGAMARCALATVSEVS